MVPAIASAATAATVATAALIGIPPSALAALSAAVLLLVLEHRQANLGGRAAIVFLFATAVYGLVRSLSIRALAEAHLGGMPYQLGSPLATIAGVPLQELVGWTAAVGLSSYFADRLLRRLGQPTDPFRTTLVAGLAMAAICLAVETAAVVGGWWSWSLAHSSTGPIRFPPIALVDWGFVAIDFLLPFELWRRRAPLSWRLAGLLLFPIHLAGHALTVALPGPIPFSGFDLVHVGLVAAVAGAAAASAGPGMWPALEAEQLRSRPALAVAVLLVTAAAQLVLAREAGLLWTGMPLAALALIAFRVRREPGVVRRPRPRARAIAVFASLLVLGLALRLPSARRARDFETLLRRAAGELVAGRPDTALPSLEGALELRPGHSEALWLLGWAELQKGNRSQARLRLQEALARRPDSVEAARLLALLDRQEGKRRADAPLP